MRSRAWWGPALGVLICTGWCGAGEPAPEPAPAPQTPIRFVERPGMRFSGRMIARPRSIESLRADPGIADRAIVVLDDARARLAPMVVEHFGATDEYCLRVPPGETESELASRLMATGAYEYVEPDWIVSLAVVPNDPDFASQWQHQKLQSTLAWDITTGSSAIICAVCDTGVDLDHPDLVAALVPGANTAGSGTPAPQSSGGDVEDVHGHGTFVGGCMAAIGNNGAGVSGGGWSLGLMPVRVTNRTDGDAPLSDITQGAIWASEHGAKIINCSYSGVSASSVQTTGATIKANGGLLFWAAGNDSANLSGFDHADVVIVGATTASDARSSFSAYGHAVDVFAPGSGVYSTRRGGDYGAGSGTSYASPIAAGVGALIWSADPMMTPDQVEQILFSGCDDLGVAGDDDFWGHGRVSAYGSMQLVTPPPSEPGAFALTTPSVGATGTGIGVHFAWTESADAGWYRIEVDDNAGFSSPVVDAPVYDTQYDVPFLTLNYSTTYHWRVTAYNLTGSTPMGIPGGDAYFSTGPVSLPGAFSLTYPAQDQTGIGLYPTLTWEASPGAETYRILVAEESGSFSDGIVDTTVGWEQLEYFIGYGKTTYGTTYHWRVAAHNGAGWTVGEPTTGSFTTVPPPAPEAFELISPGEGAQDVSTGPSFSWSESRNAESYLLEVDSEAGFEAPIISEMVYAQNLGGFGSGEVGVEAAPDTLPAGRMLYWRVTASNSWGEMVGAPDAASFTTAPPAVCLGDIDGDGATTVFDFGILASRFGQVGATFEEGDIDGDGTVTVLDFGILASHFDCVAAP